MQKVKAESCSRKASVRLQLTAKGYATGSGSRSIAQVQTCLETKRQEELLFCVGSFLSSFACSLPVSPSLLQLRDSFFACATRLLKRSEKIY